MKRYLSRRRIAAPKKDTYQRIVEVINRLDYDFKRFELNHFLAHIALRRGRGLYCRGFPFEAGIFGMWIPGETQDYIAYNSNTYHIHYSHIILHEVGHLVLGHQPVNFQAIFGEMASEFMQVLAEGGESSGRVLPRQISDDLLHVHPQEQEAETFSTLIQTRVIHANRFHYLINTSTSIAGLQAYMDAMGFSE